MTANEHREAVSERLSEIETSISVLGERVGELEKKGAVDEVHRVNVENRLKSIEVGINRVFWVAGTAIALAAVEFMLRGGLMP